MGYLAITMPQMNLFGKPVVIQPPPKKQKKGRAAKAEASSAALVASAAPEGGGDGASAALAASAALEGGGDGASAALAANAATEGGGDGAAAALVASAAPEDGGDGAAAAALGASAAPEAGGDRAALALVASAASEDGGGRVAAALAASAPSASQSGQGTLVRSTHCQMTLPILDVVCNKCGETVDPCGVGVRLVSKTHPSFICRVCNSKQAMLSQTFGRWPIDEFRELDAQEQRDFWASSATCHDKSSLKKLVENKLVRRYIESKLVTHKGPYKPLSVWEKKGYDPVSIKNGGKYWKCPVVGDTYQLRTLSDGYEKKEELVREHMLRLLSKVSTATGSAAAATEGEEGATEDAGDQEKSSSSSSSSSSSEKKKKKKKKAKKGKKEEKEKKEKEEKEKKDKERAKLQIAADKAAEKAEKSRIQKIKADASKAMAKLGPVIVQLEQTKKHDKVKLVPGVVVKKVNDALKNLQAMDSEARAKVASASPLTLTFDLDEAS